MFTQISDSAVMTNPTMQRSPWWQSSWLRPFNDSWIWHGLAKLINPLFNATLIGAQIIAIRDEAADVKTFVLQTNQGLGKRWPKQHCDARHRAGQHIALQVYTEGRFHQRMFSISSAPNSDGVIELTIKRQPKNNHRFSMTEWLHAQAAIGTKLAVTAPSGDFVLPDTQSTSAYPLVMLSAGSGITPIMSMLRNLDRIGKKLPRLLLAIYRNAEDVLFADELQRLAKRYPECSIRTHVTAADGPFDWEKFAHAYADVLQASAVYACGPNAFANQAKTICMANGAAKFSSESFGLSDAASAGSEARSWPLSLVNRKQVFTLPAKLNLLQGLESLGLNPRYGCRAGICKQCICLKRSGVVQNQQTGEQSSAPNEWISICTHRAMSPVELVLE